MHFPCLGCGPNCWMIRHVDDYHEAHRRLGNKHTAFKEEMTLLQWPVIRNSSTGLYHLLARPDTQFPLEKMLIPPGMGKMGESSQPKVKAESFLPELHATRMNWGLHAKNVLINSRGSLYHEGMDIAITGHGCHSFESAHKAGRPRTQHDKVITISQYWGYGPFHFLIECLPRVMIFMNQLLKDPSVKVHVALHGDIPRGTYDKHVPHVTKTVLSWLGIDQSRIIWGDVVAKEVYWAPQTPCGIADPIRTAWLGTYLKQELRNRLAKERPHLLPSPTQNNSHDIAKEIAEHRWLLPEGITPDDNQGHILFIRRSGTRAVRQFSELVSSVMAEFPNKRHAIYTDRPIPSFEQTLIMFYNADIIVAPHGAGESNMLASRKGTRLFELKASDWHPGNCFQILAWYAGLNFWGMAPKKNHRDSQFDLTKEEISQIAQMTRKLWEEPNKRVIDWS